MPPTADRARPHDGFTLIETIVALLILSGVLVGFYSFLSTSLNAAGRLEAASIAYDRHENALELARALNPMATPEGTFELGTYRIQWRSELIGEVRRSSKYPTGLGIFMVGLYRVTLSFPDSEIGPIAVTKVGYHRTSAPDILSTLAPGAVN